MSISVTASVSFYDGKLSIGISLGPTANITNENYNLDIFSFVKGRKLPESKRLLHRRLGATLSVSHHQGFSSLHYAFQLASVETIQVLLAAGYDPFCEDYWKMPAIFEV